MRYARNYFQSVVRRAGLTSSSKVSCQVGAAPAEGGGLVVVNECPQLSVAAEVE
jgi:hypothetical protein